jgi:hypothetical protein
VSADTCKTFRVRFEYDLTDTVKKSRHVLVLAENAAEALTLSGYWKKNYETAVFAEEVESA